MREFFIFVSHFEKGDSLNSKEKLIEKIHNGEPWDSQLESGLMGFGFQAPSKCWKDLTSLAKDVNFKNLYPQFFSRLLDGKALNDCEYSLTHTSDIKG